MEVNHDENKENRVEWRQRFEDLSRRMDEISSRVSTSEIGTSQQNALGTETSEALWRNLRAAQDFNLKMTTDMDALKQEVTQLKDKQAVTHKTVTSLERDLTMSQAETLDLRHELDKIQGDNSKMRASLSVLQSENAKLKQEVTQLDLDLQETRCDMTDVTAKVKVATSSGSVSGAGRRSMSAVSRASSEESPKLRMDVDSVQRTSGKLSADVTAQRRDIEKLRQEVSSLQGKSGDVLADVSIFRSEALTQIHNFQAAITSLQMFMAKSSVKVCFHASLSRPYVSQHRMETLVCDNIISNVGGAYDPHTGVFTAPVPGVYCFFVNTSPCQRDPDKKGRLSVVLENRRIAHVYARGLWWSSGHTAVALDRGHRIWLRTFDDDRYIFCEGWTNFTGVLVRPDL